MSRGKSQKESGPSSNKKLLWSWKASGAQKQQKVVSKMQSTPGANLIAQKEYFSED